jgi:hypothetical protein
MSSKVNKVLEWAELMKYNPAMFQAWLFKWLAISGVVLLLSVGIYIKGRNDGKELVQSSIKTAALVVAEKRASNTVDATKRLSEYNDLERELDAAMDIATNDVREYYKNNPVKEYIKVPVKMSGKKEVIYVETDGCPTVMFDDAELRIFNVGNERGELDSSLTK